MTGYRKLKVDTNLAVHAQQPYPLADVVAAIERQVRNAQGFGAGALTTRSAGYRW